MKSAARFLAILTFGATAGCQTTSVQPLASSVATKLPRGSIICVTTPADGVYGDRPYPGSGATVASAFDTALTRYADTIIVRELRESTSEQVALAREKMCTYMVIPKIAHWEDRATEWSGIRDKMELIVKIVRVDENLEIASAEIKGKSAWATFGGDHPQDLVKAPVEEFVAGLFLSP